MVATEVDAWGATSARTAGEVGSCGEEFLTSSAGDVGEKDVGSEGGTTRGRRCGLVGGDRLRWWRELVAAMGDSKSALRERGDRLLWDGSDAMELVRVGDEWPAIFCGVGGARMSSI